MLFVLITVIDYFRKNFEGLAIFLLLLILLDYYISVFPLPGCWLNYRLCRSRLLVVFSKKT